MSPAAAKEIDKKWSTKFFPRDASKADDYKHLGAEDLDDFTEEMERLNNTDTDGDGVPDYLDDQDDGDDAGDGIPNYLDSTDDSQLSKADPAGEIKKRSPPVTPLSSMADLSFVSNQLHSGYMDKLGHHHKAWQPRYFSLTDEGDGDDNTLDGSAMQASAPACTHACSLRLVLSYHFYSQLHVSCVALQEAAAKLLQR